MPNELYNWTHIGAYDPPRVCSRCIIGLGESRYSYSAPYTIRIHPNCRCAWWVNYEEPSYSDVLDVIAAVTYIVTIAPSGPDFDTYGTLKAYIELVFGGYVWRL